MLFDLQNFPRTFAIAVLLMNVMVPTIAMAEDDGEAKYTNIPAATNAKWKSECGACHVAYPPRFLPAESWRALMSGLDKHFGSDASLDAQTAREIGNFLEQHAGRSNNESYVKPILRITETRWFKREHDEVSQRVWKNPQVKSPANCTACHIQAEGGNYSEHNVRIPN